MIEQTLERIAVALERLADRENGTSGCATSPTPAVQPTPTPPVAQQPVTTPTTGATLAAAITNNAPPVQATFATPQEMVAYVMDAYTALGAEKGAAIQKVLGDLGYSNINDVTPDHYQALKDGIEALKVA